MRGKRTARKDARAGTQVAAGMGKGVVCVVIIVHAGPFFFCVLLLFYSARYVLAR